MKKRIKAFIAATLAACAITAEAATGSSGWFFVDTTSDELKISDVVSKYFDGEYGGNVGRKSTFLNGTSCEIEMDVIVDDYSKVDHWLVNGREVTDHLFTFDVGSIGVGGKLEVVAVGKKDGERSKPFRVNFDVAKHVDDETPGLWTARPSNSEGIDEIVYTLYGGSPSVAFQLAPEKNGKKPDKLAWLPGDEWSLAPKIELKPEVRSDGNGSCTFGTVGSELGTSSSEGTASHKRNRRAVGKLARVLDKEVGITFTGGPLTLSWNPQKKKWVAEDVSFGGEVSGSFGLTHHYPTPIGPMFLEGKVEAALSGMFKISGIDNGWGGLESSFTLSSERLPKVTVAGGYGINNVANVKGSLSGMSVLEATHSKGAWTDVRWGLRGSGAITAKFLPFEATLFELTSDTLWIINNSSPKSMRLMSAAPDAGLEWRLQSRDYLSSPKNGLRLMSAPGGTDFAIAESGGYPEPAPAMASGVKGDALAYLRDNAARSSANRTELVLRIGTSNEWGSVETVWDDGTADFLPSLAAMPDGSIAAAWMNAARTFADGVTVGEFCGAEEIAVGVRNAATGTWTCRNLTDDGAFDFAPAVRAASNGKVLVAWLRNASGKMTSSATEPTDIMAAIYSGGAWGEATVVQGGVGIVNGFDVAFDGENAVLAFAKDADGDPSTPGDAEICAIRSNGGAWGETTRLTAAGDADGMPLVRMAGGSFAVLWTANGVLMETAELAMSNAVAVAAADGWTLPAKPVMIRGTDGRDALVWNDISKAGGTGDAPTAMMYDPVCGAWGAPVKLFDDERRESRLSGAIGIDGGLRIGYESASVTTNAAGEMSVGTTEVRTRFVPAQCDLAVEEDGFSFSTDEFTAGEEVSLTVKAANLGFCPATNVVVKVYEEKDDAKTELASIVTNFPGGGVVAAKVPWTVDNTQTNLKFTVEIDAGANLETEESKGNNVYSWLAGMPDVSFGTVMVRNESATRRLLTANVVNKGLGPLPAGAKIVFRRGGMEGEIIAEDVAGVLLPGGNGTYSAGVAWDIEGLAFTSEWETVCVQLYPEGTAGNMADAAFMQVNVAKEKSSAVTACEDIFDGFGRVSLDGNGNIVVVLTVDVSGTVEIPDNVGAVTIDLNGHDIVGDGGPAIKIVNGDDEGDTTRLAIVDTSDGEPGQIAGGGESAGIEIAEDAALRVRLDVEGDVSVFNGDGSEQDWRALSPVEFTLTAGEYFKATLAELGYDVPTDGTPYSVVAKGLPAGLKLVSNKAVTKKVKGKAVVVKAAKSEWWIEGVPTAAVDFFTNPPYLVITANGETTTEVLPVEVAAQEVVDLGELDLGQSVNTNGWLSGVGAGWTVSGLPTGLKYATKKVTKKVKSGKRTITQTVAEAYAVYGKTTKAGLFTITAKKKKGSFYETMKYRVLVRPKAVDVAVFGETLTNITTMAYVPVEWDLRGDDGGRAGTGEDGRAGRATLPVVSNVVKVAGLPAGVTFAAKDTYKDKKKTVVKQYGQTIVGKPTKPGTYVVTFTKNVTTGTGKRMKTVAKTAQILWVVEPNDAELELEFNTAGGVVESGVVGLKYDGLMAFTATSNATVTASGLPAGIKLVRLAEGGHAGRVTLPGTDGRAASPLAAAWGFEGFTAKAGTYLVTVKATLNGKSVVQRVALVVEALPAWAKGTFNGVVSRTGCQPVQDGGTGQEENAQAARSTRGLATVTVSAAGKISGKFYEGGTNWTVSAASYTVAEAGTRDACPYQAFVCSNVVAKYSYKVKEKGKKGKWKTVTKTLTREFALTVAPVPVVPDVADVPIRGVVSMVEGGGRAGRATLPGGDGGGLVETALPGTVVTAWQNLWGGAYKAVGKKIFTTKSGNKTLAYRMFTIKATGEDGAGTGDEDLDDGRAGRATLPGGGGGGLIETALPEGTTLTLKVMTAGAVTATLTYDTGKTAIDKKTKKKKPVFYKSACSSVVIPVSAPDAEEFAGEVPLYFAPSAANNFPGWSGVAPISLPVS